MTREDRYALAAFVGFCVILPALVWIFVIQPAGALHYGY